MEFSEILRFAAALIFVIGLIAVCAWAARRFGLVQMGEKNSTRGRLAVIETLSIDPKRKLLIIRYDDHEHLILTGDQDLVLDAGRPARLPNAEHSEPQKNNEKTTFANTRPNQLAGSVAGQMQKAVSLLKERRA